MEEIQPGPRHIAEVFEGVAGGGGIEVDEGDGAVVDEHRVVRPRAVVADHGVPAGEAAATGGVVEGAEQRACGGHLGIGPPLEPGGHPAGKVGEDLPAAPVDPKVTRSAVEAVVPEFTEQLRDERVPQGGTEC